MIIIAGIEFLHLIIQSHYELDSNNQPSAENDEKLGRVTRKVTPRDDDDDDIIEGVRRRGVAAESVEKNDEEDKMLRFYASKTIHETDDRKEVGISKNDVNLAPPDDDPPSILPPPSYRDAAKNTITGGSSDDQPIFINQSRPIINPHPFKYLINCPDICRDTKTIFLLSYIHTAGSHYSRRKRIRETWAKRSNYPGVEIRTVFFIGLQPDTDAGRRTQEYIEYEAKKYKDIVQEDFVDTYHNLSHKGIGALKWVKTFCNHTSYVLKTDDDMFLNMYVILNHLKNIFDANFRRRLILCYVFWLMHVDRKGGQWSLDAGYFPSDVYPPYCSGMGFVASVDVAVAMYEVSPYVRFLWVDDAFISGVLPAALEGAVNHTSWARTYCGAFEMGVYTHPTEWYKYAFTHVHDEPLNRVTWEGLSLIIRNGTVIPRPSVITPGHLADDYIPLHKMFSPPV